MKAGTSPVWERESLRNAHADDVHSLATDSVPDLKDSGEIQREPHSLNLTQGTLIVAESESRPFCLLVDDLVGKQEVVIKSLGEKFQNVGGLAGCAILGDGRVGLILDLDGIFKGRR